MTKQTRLLFITSILINGVLEVGAFSASSSFLYLWDSYQKEPKNNLLCRQLNRMISQEKRR